MHLINNWDNKSILWIQEHMRTEPMTQFMKSVTMLGDSGWFWIVVALGLTTNKKTRKTGCGVGVSLALGALVTNVVLKPLLQRPRPYDMIAGLERLIAAQSDWSFPSGHTTASFAAAGAIFLIGSKKWGSAALVLASGIAFSRIYLGVHYATDILAGVIIGLGSSYLAKIIVDYIQRKKSSKG